MSLQTLNHSESWYKREWCFCIDIFYRFKFVTHDGFTVDVFSIKHAIQRKLWMFICNRQNLGGGVVVMTQPPLSFYTFESFFFFYQLCNSWITKVPLNALSDQIWMRYPCFSFCKMFIFICAFLVYKKQWRNPQEKTLFESKKRRYLPHFLIWLRFQGYSCKSGIAIFPWRVTILTIPYNCVKNFSIVTFKVICFRVRLEFDVETACKGRDVWIK